MSAGRRTAIHLFLMVAIGIVLGLLAPFGSAGMPSGSRLFFWVAFVLAGYAIFRPVSIVADWLVAETRVPRWLAVIMTALVAALPLSALIGFALGGMRVTPVWFGARYLILYGQVAAVGIAIHLLMMLLFAGRSDAAGTRTNDAPETAGAPAIAVSAAEPEPHPFFRRLPAALGQDLLCLEMQDHYVRVRTELGSTLLLMRFRDAISELDGLGLPVHRSWWVADRALGRLEQDGRSLRLVLTDGGTVPVSRANAAAVRAALAGRFDSPTASAKSPDRAGEAPQAA